MAEGRGTGIPKIRRSMRENGSPEPEFDFDSGRSYFRVTLPAHPEFVALSALRDAAYFKTTGENLRALKRLEEAWKHQPESSRLAVALVRQYGNHGNLELARQVYKSFSREVDGFPKVAVAMADILLDDGDRQAARAVLDRMPRLMGSQEAFNTAILERRAGRQELAHRLFMSAGQTVFSDARAAHEFAQTKIHLSGKIRRRQEE